MKEKYENCEIQIIELECEDVITGSNDLEDDEL